MSNSDNTSTGYSIDDMVANHLGFLSTHRGDVSLQNDAIHVIGAMPSLSSWTPLADQATPPSETIAVRLIPQSGATWPQRLSELGYSPAETLSYMELASPDMMDADRNGAAPIEIEVVRDAGAALVFAQVQTTGFLSGETPDQAWWSDCFETMATRNFGRSDQVFYLARDAGVPASVLLTVRTPSTVGIYAVATDPGHRAKGLSGQLLRHAYRALCGEGERFCLQATIGSYAHGFYQRRGFVERFQSQVWRKS